MTIGPIKILRIDTCRDDVQTALEKLRRQLSIQGDVVTEAGRQRTLEVFGEGLTPQQGGEGLCRDVAGKGWADIMA